MPGTKKESDADSSFFLQSLLSKPVLSDRFLLVRSGTPLFPLAGQIIFGPIPPLARRFDRYDSSPRWDTRVFVEAMCNESWYKWRFSHLNAECKYLGPLISSKRQKAIFWGTRVQWRKGMCRSIKVRGRFLQFIIHTWQWNVATCKQPHKLNKEWLIFVWIILLELWHGTMIHLFISIFRKSQLVVDTMHFTTLRTYDFVFCTVSQMSTKMTHPNPCD